ATRTGRFRAAVARAGVPDQIADYDRLEGGTPGFSVGSVTGEQTFGGTLWQNPDAYVKNSSILYFDKITTPLMIVQGLGDNNVSYIQSEEAFSALQRLGKETVLVEYKGEDHVEAAWAYENQVDYIERVLSWFEERLLGQKPSGCSVAADPGACAAGNAALRSGGG
ncbi:MAG TPA: prolyl oligopeptidase family serine peptidase, partial [Acidobacteriaceae bacterium]|nr:prolyl oligopeptidase family serine peptidase [Acidobacteriaceae bacterium]